MIVRNIGKFRRFAILILPWLISLVACTLPNVPTSTSPIVGPSDAISAVPTQSSQATSSTVRLSPTATLEPTSTPEPSPTPTTTPIPFPNSFRGIYDERSAIYAAVEFPENPKRGISLSEVEQTLNLAGFSPIYAELDDKATVAYLDGPSVLVPALEQIETKYGLASLKPDTDVIKNLYYEYETPEGPIYYWLSRVNNPPGGTTVLGVAHGTHDIEQVFALTIIDGKIVEKMPIAVGNTGDTGSHVDLKVVRERNGGVDLKINDSWVIYDEARQSWETVPAPPSLVATLPDNWVTDVDGQGRNILVDSQSGIIYYREYPELGWIPEPVPPTPGSVGSYSPVLKTVEPIDASGLYEEFVENYLIGTYNLPFWRELLRGQEPTAESVYTFLVENDGQIPFLSPSGLAFQMVIPDYERRSEGRVNVGRNTVMEQLGFARALSLPILVYSWRDLSSNPSLANLREKYRHQLPYFADEIGYGDSGIVLEPETGQMIFVLINEAPYPSQNREKRFSAGPLTSDEDARSMYPVFATAAWNGQMTWASGYADRRGVDISGLICLEPPCAIPGSDASSLRHPSFWKFDLQK